MFHVLNIISQFILHLLRAGHEGWTTYTFRNTYIYICIYTHTCIRATNLKQWKIFYTSGYTYKKHHTHWPKVLGQNVPIGKYFEYLIKSFLGPHSADNCVYQLFVTLTCLKINDWTKYWHIYNVPSIHHAVNRNSSVELLKINIEHE